MLLLWYLCIFVRAFFRKLDYVLIMYILSNRWFFFSLFLSLNKHHLIGAQLLKLIFLLYSLIAWQRCAWNWNSESIARGPRLCELARYYSAGAFVVIIYLLMYLFLYYFHLIIDYSFNFANLLVIILLVRLRLFILLVISVIKIRTCSFSFCWCVYYSLVIYF